MIQEWLLLDMHMHSEYSKINKKSDSCRVKKMTPEEFLEPLLKNKTKIFSVTDHNYFSSKWYDELEKYIEDNKINIKLINGVEFDVGVELTDNENDFIHICIYFSESVNRKQLEEKVNQLYKNDKGEEITPNFVDILNKLYELKTKFIVIPHGDKARGLFEDHKIDKLNFSEVKDYYKYAMYKVFNAYDVSPNFFGKSEKFWASNFCEKTKRFEEIELTKTEEEFKKIIKHITDKIKNQEIELDSEEQEIYNFILKYGSYFSYFNFSDWHNKEPYIPKKNNFIFGTLETAFDSFEMATLDPLSRIIVTDENEIKIPDTILQNVSFKINNSNKNVYFSPGLNAIVGKRGSGKSLLLSVIKNLINKDDKDGALQKYKSLNISDITAKNRGNINISLGGLSSVAFLTQDEIKDIFENPNKAQKTISEYFVNIGDIDISSINDIIQFAKKIRPFNQNYKNLTSNILTIKKLTDYTYKEYPSLSDVNVKNEFKNIIKSIANLSKEIEKLGLNSNEIYAEIDKIKKFQDEYIKITRLYNDVIEQNNNEIQKLNKSKTTNQITQAQNIKDINNSLKMITENFDIQLNYEKMLYLFDKFKIKNPPVGIFQKGKYLFVTYYEIPINLKEVLKEKIIDSITRANDICDIELFMKNDPNKKLKSTVKELTSNLKKYINNDDIFKAKKEFYEIRNSDIKYKDEIVTFDDLEKNILNNNLINLTNASPGTKSVAYLDMLFDLDETILILDQPEDNIDNDYISNYLVPNIKNTKKIKQLIFVTHNPSVAVYGDAFNYIYVENKSEITYKNFVIENQDDKEKLIKILEGGRESFSNRNKKFGNILGEEEYGNN